MPIRSISKIDTSSCGITKNTKTNPKAANSQQSQQQQQKQSPKLVCVGNGVINLNKIQQPSVIAMSSMSSVTKKSPTIKQEDNAVSSLNSGLYDFSDFGDGILL